MKHKISLLFISFYLSKSTASSSINLVFIGVLIAVKASTESVDKPSVDIAGLGDEALRKLTETADTRTFEAQVDRMMKLIINSLYKNKEIFLRELISNASDALDKIRILSLSKPDILKSNTDLHIFIKADKDNKQLIIRDSGIGMTKSDLIKNLGTIAKSGTSDFLQKFQSAKSEQETSDLIGQFGVGFYSAFLVADKITVISKHNDDDQYIWESDSSKFSINKDPRGNTLQRGTEIILHLKDEAEEYLSDTTLKDIARKYSQFISFPIYLWEHEKKMVDIDEEEPKAESSSDAEKKEEDSVEEEKEDKEKEKKKVEKTIWDWKQVNLKKPIWKRPPSEVTTTEYDQFFAMITPFTFEKPLAHTHFKAEGDINFNSIMYIPEMVYGDVFAAEETRSKAHVKLYVRRVFITDEIQDLIPRYLGFIRGVVDSEDLPLNVSRETLQQNKLLRLIKKKLIRKILELIQKMDKETFDKFYSKYAINLKVGVMEDRSNTARISKLLRFKSSKAQGEKEFVTLKQYVDRMKKDQKKIFYTTAPNLKEALAAPFVERAIKMGYEVILMIDSMDEYMMTALTEFEGHSFQNLGKAGVEFLETDEAKAAFENLKTEFNSLTEWLEKEALKDKISKAQVSNLLADSPCALVATEHGWSGHMERMMLSNSYKNSDDSTFSYQRNLKRILDINPRHPLIKELRALVVQDSTDEKAKELANLLFDTATLRSGFLIHDTVEFAKRIETVMRKNLGISEDAIADEDPLLSEVPDAIKESENDKAEETESDSEKKESSEKKSESSEKKPESSEKKKEASEKKEPPKKKETSEEKKKDEL
ncbi:hypothetical protein Ciccas_005168 [Cichlidogyrus casuarinus]|uniref:Histidine kinase/HSP90-like ATPase domain-containing protein n=1 Tax=Cichlidogyrus casuarinus TaxID=1844966 RepID=A0ABD2Q9F5_9PLAT